MKNPATGTTVAGQMVTPTGLESDATSVASSVLAVAPDAGRACTELTDASHLPDPSRLPSAVPSFLEACARLAARAAAEGDFDRARGLIEKASRVAEMGDASDTRRSGGTR
jgi:hypothetical protein